MSDLSPDERRREANPDVEWNHSAVCSRCRAPVWVVTIAGTRRVYQPGTRRVHVCKGRK